MVAKKTIEEDFLDNTGIFLEEVEVVDTGVKQEEVQKFMQGKNHRLEFVMESDGWKMNESIKVLGFTKKFFGENKYLLGYLPKEVTKAIIAGGFVDNIKSSPPHFRRGGRIFLDLVGNLDRRKEFEACLQQTLIEEGFVR